MLALGFFSPATAGPVSNMLLSRIQLCVRAAVRPTILASTTRLSSRISSVSNLRFDAEGSISSNTRWSQRGHDCLCRVKRSRGLSMMRAAPPWCTTTRRGAAFEREASAEEKDKGAEGEGEGEGEGDDSKIFVVKSISPSSVAAFKQCPRLFYYR